MSLPFHSTHPPLPVFSRKSRPPRIPRTPATPPLTTDSDSDSEHHSIYSDRGYRSSLFTTHPPSPPSPSYFPPTTTRGKKRAFAEVDSYDNNGAGESAPADERAGKRRILSVFSSSILGLSALPASLPGLGTVGGFVRGAWSLVRPRWPSFSAAEPEEEHAQPAVTQSAPVTPAISSASAHSPGFWDDDYNFPSPGVGRTSTISGTLKTVSLCSSAQPTSPPLLETGMGSKWVMVSPATGIPTSPTSPAAQPRKPRTPRRQRPVLTAAKRARPPMMRAPTTGLGIAGHRRTKSGGSARDEDEDEYLRMNGRIMDLIKEGREALGAKVEVVYGEDEEDEGEMVF